MSFEYIRKLPTPDEIREEFPFPAHLTELKKKRDEEIRKVLTGESNKFLVIIGPCSADSEDSGLRLCQPSDCRISEEVKDRLIHDSHVFTPISQVPPAKATRGSQHQPDPEQKHRTCSSGLIAMRKDAHPCHRRKRS